VKQTCRAKIFRHLLENKFPTGLKQLRSLKESKITESLSLEKTSKIIKSNCQPNTTMPAKMVTRQLIGDGTAGAQSTAPALGHHRDPAEDLHGCPLPKASPTMEVTLHWPLSDAAGDATSHRGQEAARSCTKDPSHQGPRSLCQQSTRIECLEARAPIGIRAKTPNIGCLGGCRSRTQPR